VGRGLKDFPEMCLLGGYFYVVGGVLFGSIKYRRVEFNSCDLSQDMVEKK
jgi:hypothetical protein